MGEFNANQSHLRCSCTEPFNYSAYFSGVNSPSLYNFIVSFDKRKAFKVSIPCEVLSGSVIGKKKYSFKIKRKEQPTTINTLVISTQTAIK